MGGMAEIFRARTATAGFDKRVCIKRVLPHYLEDEDFVTMFRDEAKTAARLQHANVVQVFDFGEVEDDSGTTLFLAMELVEGSDLRRLADQSRKKGIPLLIGEVVQIGIDVCRGLHHAHSLKDENGKTLGLVHRDISPHNILVSKNGEVKVTDFGIAKAAERATHTSTGIVKGKVAYMSPEQAEGKPFDHRLDQWATGVVLWELLCGERLFRGENDATILRKVLNVEVPAPTEMRADVPPELEAIILRALAGEPRDRFKDMREMELALSRFLFSGAIDPSTAEVAAAYARIMESGPAATPRRTAVLEAANVAPVRSGKSAAAPPAPAVAATEMIEDVGSISSDGPRDESQVFVSSERNVAAPSGQHNASAPQETQLVDDPSELRRAVASLEAKQEQSSRKNRASEASRPSHRSQASPAETAIADGALVAAARQLDSTDEDGTPATRTLVPAETAKGDVARSNTPQVAAVVPATAARGSRAPMLAAAGIIAVGAIAGVAIAVSGREAPPSPPVTTTTTTVTTTTPPAAPAPAPTPAAPPPAPVEVPPPTPAPTPLPVAPPPAPTPSTPAPPPAPAPAVVAKPPPATPVPTGKPGTVYVDVIDGWGTVTVGKKSYGETPVNITLAPGKYTVTIEKGGGGAKKNIPVTITSGGALQVRERL